MIAPFRAGGRWVWPAAVFAMVLAAQLWLVAAIGTDIPLQDQWGTEGRWLYPGWRDGTLHFADLFQAHNEHRIAWTYALDLLLFQLNGQWDPLVQLVAGAFLRGICAAVLTDLLLSGATGWRRGVIAIGTTLAFLPQLAWHNAILGFQSQVYFALLFSMLALRWLGAEFVSGWWRIAGLVMGTAALFAMGSGAFVPVALLSVLVLRVIERRRWSRRDHAMLWPAVLLLIAAVAARAPPPIQHLALHAQSFDQFARTLARVLAWPHVTQPLAAVALNAPLLIAISSRLVRRRTAVPGEDAVLLLAAWSAAGAFAMAWARGGSDEFLAGVPSRYVDFVVLLPMANAWYVLVLAKAAGERIRRVATLTACAWSLFLATGWIALSAETMRYLVLPRARDRDAPVRLAVAFAATGDPRIFDGQPRLLIPAPNLGAVTAVLHDSRLQGFLPPSFQPERPIGPLSRAVRSALRR